MAQKIRGDEWIRLVLEKFGIDPSNVRRVVIDAQVGHVLMFYIEHFGTSALLEVRPPEAWESGFKDTVIAYPGEVTRIRAQFINPGQFVWHCHIVEHEDNEMMRPFRVGPEQPGQPGHPM